MTDDPTKQKAGDNEDPKAAAEDGGIDGKGSGSDAAGQKGSPEDKGKGGEPQTIEVTVDVLRSMRNEIKSLKDQGLLYKSQLEASQHLAAHPTAMPNVARNAQGAIAQAQVDDGTGEIKLDIDDDDVITGAELKKVLKSLPKGHAPGHLDPVVAERLAILELNTQDPNWQATIKEYLPEMINSNPMVVQQIRGSENPLQAALLFAKMNPKYAAAQKGLANADGTVEEEDGLMSQIDKIIANAEKPGGGHKAGSSSGVNVADKFANMSDEEFDAHVEKVLQGTVK